jgi:DNA-binding SARP family transcriptional activator
MLEYRILGPLEVVADGAPLTLGGPKQRATLAILLLEANRVVSVERIADELYQGRPPVTAVTQVQRHVSELRRLLGPTARIETRAPGYRIRVERDQLDLSRFERLTAEGVDALERGDARRASELCHEALALWRGDPLVDLEADAVTRIARERLDELRIAALETRIEADLGCGRHARLTAELDALVAEHPYREALHAQRMLALYRSGRQAEALDAFRSARGALSDGLGLEPGPRLRWLQRAILAHDPALELEPARKIDAAPSVLVVPCADARIAELVAFAAAAVDANGSELLVARLLDVQDELPAAVSALHGARKEMRELRTAAFTTAGPADDVVRLVTSHDIGLVIADSADRAGDPLSGWVADLLDRSPVDVAILVGAKPGGGRGVVVPFGGGGHGWAALELGARLAVTTGEPLTVAGTAAIAARGRRDASRLLADASLAVQKVLGIDATPVLVDPSADAVIALAGTARLVALGVPERWRVQGLGQLRTGLLRESPVPVALVHRGPRPGALAPHASRTSFTWTIEGATA